jgi:ABC-2 type transport system permease protein
MSDTLSIKVSNKTVSSSPSRPAWWLVFSREMVDLWVGGKALVLILIYSIFLGVVVYVSSTNSELSLIPPKEMVYETLKNAMAVSLFIGLIIGADSLSGDRERNTFEALLLTPASRSQIVTGKFLAAVSPWPAAMLIAIPYLNVISQGDEVLGPAILWGAITGTVLVLAYTGLGMLVSFWSNSNRTSYFVSLGLYILILVPAQLPGRAQTGVMGQFLQWINPLAAVNHFLSKHLVNYRTLAEFWTWLISPAVFAIIVLGLLFLFAGPGLRLEAGRKTRLPAFFGRRMSLFGVAFLITTLAVSPVNASQEALQTNNPLAITIDMEYSVVKTGDKVEFTTMISNQGDQTSNPLIVAMNIINLDAQGDVVDPEDWSPQRTQYLVNGLEPGESTALSWIINTILDGDYMIYMVLLDEPDSQETTSHPVASSGIHLTVTPYTRLNPLGVLPYVIGGPVLLLVAIFVVFRVRRRAIDAGG